MATTSYDLFVSYAHADDEVPVGASKGWVTTLADELNKVLRRKLGGSGARTWMDHQLAANANVSEALLDTVRASQTLLLVMSPGYRRSAWCQRELGDFLARSTSRKGKDNVFVVEIDDRVARESWHPSLQSLKSIRFWHKAFDDIASRLLGFPVPKLDEDSLYWRKVNELAHLIAEYLDRDSSTVAPSKPAVLLAETAEDLLDKRESVATSLRQAGYEVLPESDLPKDSEAAYVHALRTDLARVQVFAQLLGPYEGRKPQQGQTSFVALQASQAVQARKQGDIEILQWRAPEVDLDRVPSPAYRELLQSRYVQGGGLEEFKRQILKAAAVTPTPRKALEPSAPPVRPGDSPGPSNGRRSDLYIYVNADRIDRDVAIRVGDSLTALGVTTAVSPEAAPEQTPQDIRRAQQEQLEGCDGVLLVYGQTPDTWIQSQFAFARRIVAPRKRGVWCSLLDVAPPDRPTPPVRSPSLVVLDCRQKLDQTKLAWFVETLRANGGAVRA
jgi:hypothetical protein